MLKETTLFGEIDKEKIAVDRLQNFEPPEGYYLAFSGGKDSIVIKALADMSQVKYDAHYNVTTIDPPELVRFIHTKHPDVIFDHPKEPFLQRMVKKGFPMRQSRWCCEEYKENGGTGRTVVTGIRRLESYKRSKRRWIEICYKDITKKFLNVIIDWTEKDVWDFVRKYNLSYCKLYDEGWKRIGCLFCPLGGSKMRFKELEKYPQMGRAFIRAFEKLYQDRKKRGLKSVDRWKNGKEMFYWWIDG